MDRRKFIKGAGVVAGSTVFGRHLLDKDLLPALGTSTERPNILFIMTDQQSYNMMSCMGNVWLRTPNMDKIAAMGTRFERTFATHQPCPYQR